MVFISYKNEEYDIAKKIRVLLEENNYPCWMAPESIPAGSNYMSEIPQAIKSCDLFVLLLSESSQKSQWVQKEIDRAVKFDKYILPFHTDQSELSDAIDFVISNNQRIEAYNNFEKACEELLTAVRIRHPTVESHLAESSPVNESEAIKIQPSEMTESVKPVDANVPLGISPEILMQLLGNLPPEYIKKLISDYQPDATLAPALTTTDPITSDPIITEPITSEPIITEPITPEPITPEPITPEPIITEPIASSETTKNPVEELHNLPEIPHEPTETETVSTDPISEAISEGSSTSAPIHTPAQETPYLFDPEDDEQTVPSQNESTSEHDARCIYEHKYEQNNISGFKIWLGKLTGYKSGYNENGTVVIPYGVKEITDSVFAKCKSIYCVVLPPTLEKIGIDAFADCVNLKEVIFHEGLLSVDFGAFKGCHQLKSIIFPKSLTHIGSFAFFDCTEAIVTIPPSIAHIGSAAFNNCTSVTVQPQHPSYTMNSGCIVDKAERCVISATTDAKLPTSLSIKMIGDYAFYGNCSISGLNFNGNIKRIGIGAFKNCLNLTEVNIGSGIEFIGKAAFMGCTALHTLTMKFGVSVIDQQAFSQCKNLRNAVIPQSVSFCAKDAFEGCPRIKITN